MYSQMILGTWAYLASYFYLQNQSWYAPQTGLSKDDTWNFENEAVSTLFLVTNILFTLSIVGFYISTPFKKRIWSNYGLFVWQTVTLIYNILIFLVPKIQMGAMKID